jgi:hypothetical protein
MAVSAVPPSSLAGPSRFASSPMKITRVRLVAIISVIVVAAGFGAYYFFVRHNPAASCVGCRAFVRLQLDIYGMKHDGWYPKDAGSPMRSLALAIADETEREQKSLVHVFTSHALTRKAEAYYAEHRTFHEDYSCYRYNEGLKSTDDRDMILVYYFEPTRWEDISPRRRANFIGRNVLTAQCAWEFIPEAEFQRRQAATLALLATRKN